MNQATIRIQRKNAKLIKKLKFQIFLLNFLHMKRQYKFNYNNIFVMSHIISQVSKILQSDFNKEASSTVQAAQKEINYLQSIIKNKSKEVVQLQNKFYQELDLISFTNKNNIKLEEQNKKLKAYIRKILGQYKQCYTYCSNQTKRTLKQYETYFKQWKSYVDKYLAEVKILKQPILPENKRVFSVLTQTNQCNQIQIKQSEFLKLKRKIQQLNEQNKSLKQKLQILERQNHGIKTQDIQENYQSITKQLTSQEIRQIFYRTYYPSLELLEKKYVGQTINGLKNGQGTCYYNDGFIYIGTFVENRRHGIGVLMNGIIEVYRGYWKQNLFHGKGILHIVDHQIFNNYKGNFENGMIKGYGTMKTLDNTIIRGRWTGFQACGDSILVYKDRNQQKLGKLTENRFITQAGEQIQL